MKALIREYLQSNTKDYDTGVQLIQATDPAHPLLSSIQKGDSFINRHYLTTALKQILEKAEVKINIPGPSETITKKKDPTLYQLTKEQRALIIKGKNLSNSYYTYLDNPKKCAQIHDDNTKIHKQIRAITKKIAHYLEFGEVPPEPKQLEDFEIPDQPIQQMKTLNSLRASRSYHKKQLKKATTKESKLKHEEKLSQIEHNIKELEKVINGKN